MRQLGAGLPAVRQDSQPSVPTSGGGRWSAEAMLAIRQEGQLPALLVREADIDIPRRALEAWIPADGSPRRLRRPLDVQERATLMARRDQLEAWVCGYSSPEQDEIVLAVSDMYSGFGSVRMSTDEAAMRVDAVLRLLIEYPAWAIIRACRNIQRWGVWREGKYCKRWAPNDPELVAQVENEVRLHRDAHASAVALLNAEVAG